MEYTLKKTIEDSSYRIRIYSPVITDEERQKRMKAIHKATEHLLKKVHTR